jgi:hypothetical protein
MKEKTMNTDQMEHQALQSSRQKVLAIVSRLLGTSVGREDDDHPLRPGPWDPVIRAAIRETFVLGPHPEPWRVAGPLPEPWRNGRSVFGIGAIEKLIRAGILARHPEIYDAIGGGHNFAEEVALNPQPLPPRYVFLTSVAQVVISRAELLQDIAGAGTREGDRQGIIVGGYVSRFCDEWCGNGFRLRWPFPGPRPHWLTHELDGTDLVVLAAGFENGAQQAFNADLARNLTDASARFLEAGLSKMQ